MPPKPKLDNRQKFVSAVHEMAEANTQFEQGKEGLRQLEQAQIAAVTRALTLAVDVLDYPDLATALRSLTPEESGNQNGAV